MLINIFWLFDKVGGGGNQFLNSLKRYLIKNNLYEENPFAADILLINSKDLLKEASLFSGKKTIIHRIDGVFTLYRGTENRDLDLKVYEFTRKYANGVIFQSEWSKFASKSNGMGTNINEIVIKNGADNRFFNCNYEKRKNKKFRIITTSWSDNWKKGFDIYDFLDQHLDFEIIEYIFVGRSPIKFNNIQMKGCLDSKHVAEELKKSDMFLTVSEDDACSNSLIEALSCGIPSVALKSGGNTEIIGKNNGELFDGKKDIIAKIDKARHKIAANMYNISVDSIEEVGSKYVTFMEGVSKNERKV